VEVKQEAEFIVAGIPEVLMAKNLLNGVNESRAVV
jgi:hypothetical protein